MEQPADASDRASEIESNEAVMRLSQRSMALATACLAVVVLVMVVSLAIVVGIAGSAQQDADDASVENADLRAELSCRSVIAAEFSVLQGRLESTIAEGLVLLSRGEDLDGIEAELSDLSAQLEAAAITRQQTAADCLVKAD